MQGSGCCRSPRQQGQQREPAAAASRDHRSPGPSPASSVHGSSAPSPARQLLISRTFPSPACSLAAPQSPCTPRRSPSAPPLSSLGCWIPRPSSPTFPCAQQPEASCLPSSMSRYNQALPQPSTPAYLHPKVHSCSPAEPQPSTKPQIPKCPNFSIPRCQQPCSPGALQCLPAVPTAHHPAEHPSCGVAPELHSSMCRQPQSQQLGPSPGHTAPEQMQSSIPAQGTQQAQLAKSCCPWVWALLRLLPSGAVTTVTGGGCSYMLGVLPEALL